MTSVDSLPELQTPTQPTMNPIRFITILVATAVVAIAAPVPAPNPNPGFGLPTSTAEATPTEGAAANGCWNWMACQDI
ncbi:13395_t:CDS:2 [Acaulospora colombiana]|uniref:13395_t:CDS:1 n=1 Tax=Acaulospora colombiana TaxID=27376 RepID=A0ACA9PIW7_9GLOM|nr:13395_t:CDS:2 [Acaulospora colombiana]